VQTGSASNADRTFRPRVFSENGPQALRQLYTTYLRQDYIRN
jgi:hypothetical protein